MQLERMFYFCMPVHHERARVEYFCKGSPSMCQWRWLPCARCNGNTYVLYTLTQTSGMLNHVLCHAVSFRAVVCRIGLKRLHEAGSLQFETAPGEHMQFSIKWFKREIIAKYLAGTDARK